MQNSEENQSNRSSLQLIDKILKHKSPNQDIENTKAQLIDIIKNIPNENIGEGSDVVIREDNTLVFLIKHAKDQLRLVHLIFSENNIFVNVCFMKDSLMHQYLKCSNLKSFSEFSQLYLDSIFGSDFEKKIVYKGKQVFECELCFDSHLLPNKIYISKKNKLRKLFFGSPKKDVQVFRYLSFFTLYNYEIKNEIIDRE